MSLEHQERKVLMEHLVFPALREIGASPVSQAHQVNLDVMAHQVYQDQRDWMVPQAYKASRETADKMAIRDLPVPPDLSDLPDHLVSPA